ncbi:MAG TPA: DUF86 domain-containing protein [Acidimicrobiia bacterium]|nr:DUF86 domain-containing protein [Acidimicrobiia bacterium]
MTISEHDRDSVETILAFCGKITSKIEAVSLEQFLLDEDIQDIIIRRIMVIGEACTRLSNELREQNEKIEVKKIIGLRNILVHGYDAIDLESVYLIATERVKELSIVLNEVL